MVRRGRQRSADMRELRKALQVRRAVRNSSASHWAVVVVSGDERVDESVQQQVWPPRVGVDDIAAVAVEKRRWIHFMGQVDRQHPG